ncbi:MAG: sulfite exporter TauE/SafE family protein [Xanthobacteraceae bacterium]|nr:sulfite exporter TauE/SafE family protein [Xanthobacteraceae bacterium]
MTFFQIVLLAAAGFAAGTVNAIAGGGTFATFAALVACGLPTLDANATSAVALTPANLASVVAYRSEIRTHFRSMVPFALTGLAGGAIGSLLLIWLGDQGFRPLVPWLLLSATLMFAFSDQIRRLTKPMAQQGGGGGATRVVAFAVMALATIYGGFFGAGMGIMMLAALAVIGSGDYHEDNAVKNVVAFLIQIVSAAILIAGGLVHWPQAMVTIVASVIGGYWGVSVARNVPVKVIRAAVVLVGAVLTVIFFVKG